MKKIHLALCVLLLSLSIFGQTTQKSDLSSPNQKPLKTLTGEDFMPYLFEPYQADYVFKGKLIGLSFRLFSISTKIVELPDEWQETHFIRVSKKPDADFQDIKITSNIDSKTGLLKKMVTESGKNIAKTIEIRDGNIFVGETFGKKSKSYSFPAKEAVYPCNYSNTFLSYLPLNDNFARSFTCFSLDETDSGKPKIRFSKRTLRVASSERKTSPPQPEISNAINSPTTLKKSNTIKKAT
jgi:hypothetical protein